MRFSQTQNFIISVLVSLALIFMPAREAKAFLPLPVALAVYGAPSAGAAVAGVDLFAGPLAIGLALGLLTVSTPAGDTARFPTNADPANVPPVPYAPSTAASSGQISYSGLWGSSNDLAAYVSNAKSHYCGTTAGCDLYVSPTFITDHQLWSTSNNNVTHSVYETLTVTQVTTCSAGYTLTSGVCNLTDARAASPDKKCDYQRSGSALAMISDPDCAKSGGLIPAICASGGISCSGVGTSPAGEPRSFIITPTADGGSTITTFQQNTSSGQTTVTSDTTTVSSSGSVVAVSTNTTTGSINTSTGTVTTGSTVSPAAPAPVSTINFPSDYARTGEAATAAATLAPKLDTLHNDLNPTNMPSDVATQAQTDLANANAGRDQFKTDIQGIPTMADPVTPPSLFQPFQSGACSPLSYTFGSSMTAGSHTVTLDLCPWVPTIQRIGAWGMYLLTAAMLFQMFTRRPDEA